MSSDIYDVDHIITLLMLAIPRFYQYYGLNGQGYLGEVKNKYGIEPETFADYMRTRSPKDL